MRTVRCSSCSSGGDRRVTQAASPRSGWLRRTEQVTGVEREEKAEEKVKVKEKEEACRTGVISCQAGDSLVCHMWIGDARHLRT